MPNLSEFPVGASLLDDLGGIYALEEQINLNTVLASESGIGGGIPSIPDTAHLPGVCFRFDGSDRANYCKILRVMTEAVHLEFRDLRRPAGMQLVEVAKFIDRDDLKQAFFDATGLYVPSYEPDTEN